MNETNAQQAKHMHKMHEEEKVPMSVPSCVENDKKFNSVNKKTLTFHSVKSVIFTRLESSTSQKVQIFCTRYTGSEMNLMPLIKSF